MAKYLLAPPQGRYIALQRQDALRRVLSPPLFTSSSIDSCVPIFTTRNKIQWRLFFLSVKAVPNVLMLAEIKFGQINDSVLFSA